MEIALKVITNLLSILLVSSFLFYGNVCAQENTNTTIKWTPAVGETIKILNIETSGVFGERFKMATYTYESLKNCSSLSVFGTNYSKDGIHLGTVSLPAQRNTKVGQKYRESTQIVFEPSHYIVFDREPLILGKKPI